MTVFPRLRALTACLAALLVLGGCSLAPKYERESFDMPSQWRKVNLTTQPLYTDWWKRFNDPVLTALVEEALKNNLDLAEGMARIESAAAQAGVATSALFPLVTGDAGAGAQSMSERSANYSKLADRSYTTYQGSLSAACNSGLSAYYWRKRALKAASLLAFLSSGSKSTS